MIALCLSFLLALSMVPTTNALPPEDCGDGVDDDQDFAVDDEDCDQLSDDTNPINCIIDGDRDPCAILRGQTQCSDGDDNDGDAATDWPRDAGCDSPDDNTEGPTPACFDGIDNDGTGGADFPNDPQCLSPYDSGEGAEACNDGVDSDGDGRIDFPADTGCLSLFDATEGPNPACSDALNNDGDIFIDFPADPQCENPYDATE